MNINIRKNRRFGTIFNLIPTIYTAVGYRSKILFFQTLCSNIFPLMQNNYNYFLVDDIFYATCGNPEQKETWVNRFRITSGSEGYQCNP
jgi:hypothetical protein